ncbi:hypothetical protein RM549_14075 [Salegentibacter sp. F188]|uniref:Transcriptional regulator n=1 Tax=Autumnicola patrickiae TaxID=3075591 RepID=A0ABU3E4K4_9FLAO|nr:hypothetical protein [Salegentibacter sp. F188]MDT0690920.1 hypothetical protein [Salegentibacter sp. F188]
MNYIKQLNSVFEKFYFDDRLNPTHISLYMALFQEWNSSRFAAEFFVNRREIMLVAKIGSKSTYHRCIVDMDQWGYLSYFPSNNPYKGSKVKMTSIRVKKEALEKDYDPLLEELAEEYYPISEPAVVQNRPIIEQVVNQQRPTSEQALNQHRPTSEQALNQHRPISGQALNQHRPISGQALVSYINNTKQININKQPKDRQAVLYFFKEKGFSADEGKKFFEYYREREWKTSNDQDIKNWKAVAKNWIDRTELYRSSSNQTRNGVSQIQDNLKTTKTKDYGQPL